MNQHSTQRKFALRWRGPFVVVKVYDNAVYSVRELDGAIHRIPYAGKRVKLFKRRMKFDLVGVDEANHHQEDEDDSTDSEESRGDPNEE